MPIFYQHYLKQTLKQTAKVAVVASALLFAAPIMAPRMASTLAISDRFEGTVQHEIEGGLNKQRRRRPRRALPSPPRRLPPNQVQPGGGLDASVQACESQSAALTALVPVENPVYTTSAHTTFLFYLPDEPESVQYAEFILLSADEKEQIYTTQFVPSGSGIVSVTLPKDEHPGLETNEAYHWYLNLHCQTTASVPSVNGWVQRVSEADAVSSSVEEERARTNSLNSAEGLTMLQAENEGDVALPEIWYDAIAQTAASLESLERTGTDELTSTALQTQWAAWLTAVGLEEVVDQPILGPVDSREVVANRQ